MLSTSELPSVTTDPDAALAAVRNGASVVLLATAKQAARVRAAAVGETGRLGVVVGDPDDASDRAAAEAMAEEVFGRR